MKVMQPEVVYKKAWLRNLILDKIERETNLFSIFGFVLGLLAFSSLTILVYYHIEEDIEKFFWGFVLGLFTFLFLMGLVSSLLEKRRFLKINSRIMGYFDNSLITRVAVWDISEKIREDLVNCSLEVLLYQQMKKHEEADEVKDLKFKPLFLDAKYTKFIDSSETWSVFFDLAKERKDLWDDLWDKVIPGSLSLASKSE